MTEFEEWFRENYGNPRAVESGYKQAKEAWNAAVEAVDKNITYRDPQTDQDIWEIYTND